MKPIRIYDTVQPSNTEVVDKVVLHVHTIEQDEVIFVINPNLQEYHETETSQSIGFEAIDDTRWIRMRSGSTQRVEVDGSKYDISVESIGTEMLQGRQRRYCDFVIKSVPL